MLPSVVSGELLTGILPAEIAETGMNFFSNSGCATGGSESDSDGRAVVPLRVQDSKTSYRDGQLSGSIDVTKPRSFSSNLGNFKIEGGIECGYRNRR